MTLLDFRVDQHIPTIDDLYVSGEFVLEFAGRCRSATYCTVTPATNQIKEWAWHAELGYKASNWKLKPFVEVGFVYFSNDFTPIALGWSDWGKWYMGNQIDWIVFGNNSKIIRADAGFWPHEQVKVHLQFHNTRLVTGARGTLSNEYGLITEWYPNDWFWVNLLAAYADVRGAFAASGLTNTFVAINAGADPVGTNDSVDVVLGAGVFF